MVTWLTAFCAGLDVNYCQVQADMLNWHGRDDYGEHGGDNSTSDDHYSPCSAGDGRGVVGVDGRGVVGVDGRSAE